MKHRYSFITSFFILITVCTMVILGLFKNVQENATYDEFALGDQTVEAISYLMLEKAAELDPNYEMIQVMVQSLMNKKPVSIAVFVLCFLNILRY